MMKKILLEDVLILNTAKTARFLVRVLPLRLSLFLGAALGATVYLFTKRSHVAYKNLRAAFSGEKSPAEMRSIARRSIQNLAVSAVEMLRFPDLDLAYIRDNVEFTGLERFEPVLKEKKGFIFLTAHFGNWEFLNVAAGVLGYPMVAVMRAQKHPRSDEFLNSLRTSKGNQVIRKGMPLREILRALRGGKIVGILSDQDGGKKGTFVPFFGRLSSCPSGVATFALRTGAPIFPVFIFRKGGLEHRVEVEGPLALPDPSLPEEEIERMILQQFVSILESKIRKAPDQWLWAHRRWKSTPDRSILVLSDGKTGHLNQSLAVLEAIKDERKARGVSLEHTRAKVLEVRFESRASETFFKAVCLLTGGHIPFKSWMLKRVLKRECAEEILKTYADIVISCGASVAGVNLLVTRENRAKSVVIMKPPFGAGGFDVVIAPRHDNIKQKDNIFITDKALSLISESYLGAEAARLTGEISFVGGQKKVGLLVGGDTADVKFSKTLFRKTLAGLERFSKETGSVLLATSSRRTPGWADELLKSVFSSGKQCPLLVIPNESNRQGVVGGILGLCDVLVVSGESVSMVSEAVSSGKPVVVFMPWERKLKTKYQAFLDRLFKEKLAVPASPENIYEVVSRHMAHTNGIGDARLSKDRETLTEAVRRVAQ